MKTLIAAILGAGAGVGLALLLRPKPPKKIAVWGKDANAILVETELAKSGIKTERVPLKNPVGFVVTVDEENAEKALKIIEAFEKSGALRKGEMGRVNIVAPGNRVGFSKKFVDDLHYS